MPTRFILQRRASLGIVELMEQRFPDRIQHRLGNRRETIWNYGDSALNHLTPPAICIVPGFAVASLN
jgi:hypothetical protein